MASNIHHNRIVSTTIIATGAFAGCNLFIGLSMGTYWLGMEPLDFASSFGSFFARFLITIMPLFLLTLIGLVLSTRLDWHDQKLRRDWLIAIGFYITVALITLIYHMPENLRLLSAVYTTDAQASGARSYWLIGHIPRVVLSFGTVIFGLRAAMNRSKTTDP